MPSGKREDGSFRLIEALKRKGITEANRPAIDRWLADHGKESKKENVLEAWAALKATNAHEASSDPAKSNERPIVELKIITKDNATFHGTLRGKDAETVLRQVAPLLLGFTA